MMGPKKNMKNISREEIYPGQRFSILSVMPLVSYPCNRAWRILAKLMSLIVVLENANAYSTKTISSQCIRISVHTRTIDPTKGAEQGTETTKYAKPGL